MQWKYLYFNNKFLSEFLLQPSVCSSSSSRPSSTSSALRRGEPAPRRSRDERSSLAPPMSPWTPPAQTQTPTQKERTARWTDLTLKIRTHCKIPSRSLTTLKQKNKLSSALSKPLNPVVKLGVTYCKTLKIESIGWSACRSYQHQSVRHVCHIQWQYRS